MFIVSFVLFGGDSLEFVVCCFMIVVFVVSCLLCVGRWLLFV